MHPHRTTSMLPVLVMLLLAGIAPVNPAPVRADETTRDIILLAMQDEMQRNIEQLRLEGMADPFFISYTVADYATLDISASLGSIIASDESRDRTHSVRLMVGDYRMNDENFEGSGGTYRSGNLNAIGLPIEDDYDGIRRAFWITTDAVYKSAAELFEHKKTALEQQVRQGEEAELPDFSREPAVRMIGEPARLDFDAARWETVARELSAVFTGFPEIHSSYVTVSFHAADRYFVNTEGTVVVQPVTAATLQVNCFTQAVDGEPLADNLSYYAPTPDNLPSPEEMKTDAAAMARYLAELRTAPVFDDSYLGPVMLAGEAVPAFFSQRLFGGSNGLIAKRRPVVTGTRSSYGGGSDDSLEDRIGRRILSHDLSVLSLPALETFEGTPLLGSYAVDAEGVVPPDEVPLVEEGILQTLLSNRIPTTAVRMSNGHERPVIGHNAASTIGPGVISVSSSNGQTAAALRERLLTLAEREGFEYGVMVERLKPLETGAPFYDPSVQMTQSYGGYDGASLSQPLRIYRVYVEDGREEPVRSAQLGTVSLSTLRHIAGATSSRTAHNMPASAGYSSGVPASFIVPDAVLLEELDVSPERRDYTPRLPMVPHPLSRR